MYNNGNASSPGIYPAEAETQGMASFAAHLGLQPQDLFANCLTFFAILLLATLVFTLLLPVACLVIRRAFSASHAAKNPSLGRGHHAHHSSASSFGGEGYGEAPTTHLSRGRFDSIVLSGTSSSKELNYPNLKSAGNKYGDVPVTPSTAGDGYIPSLRSPTRQGRSHGIHRWWEGDKERHSRSSDHSRHSSHSRSAENAADPVPPSLSIYHSIPSWFAFFQGSVIRLVIFFHLPITTFAVYQLAHASSSATIVTVVFATCVLVVFSLAIPAYTVFHIRKTLTRYLQDDTNTLLAYGPAYNTYAQDSYTFAMVRFTANFVEGCVVGGAQNRATIQVAIILAVEIVETLVTVSFAVFSPSQGGELTYDAVHLASMGRRGCARTATVHSERLAYHNGCSPDSHLAECLGGIYSKRLDMLRRHRLTGARDPDSAPGSPMQVGGIGFQNSREGTLRRKPELKIWRSAWCFPEKGSIRFQARPYAVSTNEEFYQREHSSKSRIYAQRIGH